MITITVKFILLFMDFFIPYVFFFYMLFGGPQENAVLTKIKEKNDFSTIADAVSSYFVTIMQWVHRQRMENFREFVSNP